MGSSGDLIEITSACVHNDLFSSVGLVHRRIFQFLNVKILTLFIIYTFLSQSILNKPSRYLRIQLEYFLSIGQWLTGIYVVLRQVRRLHFFVAVTPGTGMLRSSFSSLLFTLVPGTVIQRTCNISGEFGGNFTDSTNSTAAS